MWFSVDSCGDVKTFDTAAEAEQDADEALGEERSAAAGDGWSEEVTDIMWGKVHGVCKPKYSRPVNAEEDYGVPVGVDMVCDYHITGVSDLDYLEIIREARDHCVRFLDDWGWKADGVSGEQHKLEYENLIQLIRKLDRLTRE